MNQGKLEVVKQEMARVNIEILGISKTKWTGMGEFNSDDQYVYYCGQESLRRNGIAIIVNKRVQKAVLGCNLKNDRMIHSFPRETIQYHRNPSLCPNKQFWRSWSWMILWRLTRPSRTNTPKWKWKKVKVKSFSRVRLFVTPWTVAYQAPPPMGFSRQEYWSGLPFPSPRHLPHPGIETGSNTPNRCLFHYRELECRRKKSRDTWSNRQIWPWSTKWSRANANRVLPREHTGHTKHPLPTTQEMTLHMDITRWLTLKSDWLYSLQPKMEKLYTVSKNKTGSWLWLRSCVPYCQIQT